jgi:hypothetical protein
MDERTQWRAVACRVELPQRGARCGAKHAADLLN